MLHGKESNKYHSSQKTVPFYLYLLLLLYCYIIIIIVIILLFLYYYYYTYGAALLLPFGKQQS